MIYSVANFSGHFEQEGIFSRSFSAISVPRYFKIFIDDDGILRFNYRPDNHEESLWLQQPNPASELTSIAKLEAAAARYSSFPFSSFRLTGQAADIAGGSSVATLVCLYLFLYAIFLLFYYFFFIFFIIYNIICLFIYLSKLGKAGLGR
jgi:hypothetical protein